VLYKKKHSQRLIYYGNKVDRVMIIVRPCVRITYIIISKFEKKRYLWICIVTCLVIFILKYINTSRFLRK